MRQLLAIFFLVSCVFSVKAQERVFKPQLYIGAGGGALFSTVDFVPALTQKSHPGIHGGISAKYISEKHLGLLLEANIAQRGWEEAYDNNPEFSYSRNLTYLEIPLLTHVYFGNNVRFIFNAGPQISFLMGSKSNMSQALSDHVAQQTNPTTGPYIRYQDADRKFDYGLLGGVGMAIKTGVGDFDLEGRYYFGLGDIFTTKRDEAAGTGYYSRSAHRIIEAKLTYYLKIF